MYSNGVSNKNRQIVPPRDMAATDAVLNNGGYGNYYEVGHPASMMGSPTVRPLYVHVQSPYSGISSPGQLLSPASTSSGGSSSAAASFFARYAFKYYFISCFSLYYLKIVCQFFTLFNIFCFFSYLKIVQVSFFALFKD